MTDFTGLTPLPSTNAPIAVSPSDAARLIGIGRTTLYAALASGALKSAKIGKRRLITITAINEWLESCAVQQDDGESTGGSR